MKRKVEWHIESNLVDGLARASKKHNETKTAIIERAIAREIIKMEGGTMDADFYKVFMD